MRKKPVIGLTPYYDQNAGRTWMRRDYTDCIFKAGGMPCTLPIPQNDDEMESLCDSLDGYLIVGGEDIDPKEYGQEASPLCGEICAERDRFELELVKRLVQMDKPVAGICRGVQVINVALGGSVIQDIPSMHRSDLIDNQEAPYEKPVHRVELQKGTLLHQRIGKGVIEVNSWHHQSIDRLGEGLVVNAMAPDGIIEGVELPGKRLVLGVQWHPEFLWGTPSAHFFELLVEKAK